MRINKIISVILVLLICITINGCQIKNKGNQTSKEKNLNIYVDVKDKNSLNIIKFLTEEYKKDNSNLKIKINDVLGGGSNISEDISKGTEADIVFTSRNTMMELSQKGLIADMGQYFEKNKVNEKYYNIIPAYGRVGDKYYGISLLPYTLEVFYNAEALNKLGIAPPKNIMDMDSIIKKFSSGNIRIPVVLTEDLDINTALSSIVASNKIKLSSLDKDYDNSAAYKNMKEMQGIFDVINTGSKQMGISKNLFELGNESTLTSLINGTVPLVVSTSYYYNELKDTKINLIENYTVSASQKGSVPVIVNTLLCMPTNAKNGEEVVKFIKYALSDSTQDKLVGKGYITGNKSSNKKLSGIGVSIDKHLSDANDNSILYVYSLPKKFQGLISAKIDNILNNKYTGHEWTDIVNEVYK